MLVLYSIVTLQQIVNLLGSETQWCSQLLKFHFAISSSQAFLSVGLCYEHSWPSTDPLVSTKGHKAYILRNMMKDIMVDPLSNLTYYFPIQFFTFYFFAKIKVISFGFYGVKKIFSTREIFHTRFQSV